MALFPNDARHARALSVRVAPAVEAHSDTQPVLPKYARLPPLRLAQATLPALLTPTTTRIADGKSVVMDAKLAYPLRFSFPEFPSPLPAPKTVRVYLTLGASLIDDFVAEDIGPGDQVFRDAVFYALKGMDWSIAAPPGTRGPGRLVIEVTFVSLDQVTYRAYWEAKEPSEEINSAP